MFIWIIVIIQLTTFVCVLVMLLMKTPLYFYKTMITQPDTIRQVFTLWSFKFFCRMQGPKLVRRSKMHKVFDKSIRMNRVKDIQFVIICDISSLCWWWLTRRYLTTQVDSSELLIWLTYPTKRTWSFRVKERNFTLWSFKSFCWICSSNKHFTWIYLNLEISSS